MWISNNHINSDMELCKIHVQVTGKYLNFFGKPNKRQDYN
jgi:hypothetical protein